MLVHTFKRVFCGECVFSLSCDVTHTSGASGDVKPELQYGFPNPFQKLWKSSNHDPDTRGFSAFRAESALMQV